jgi:nucleotide-binding universal stress UspA family protein
VRVIVGVDGSESSQHALRWGLDEGRARNCSVVALLAYGFYGRPKQVQDLASGFDDDELFEVAQRLLRATVATVTATLASSGLPVIQTVVAGTEPADALLDFADEDDVLVLGSRRLGPVRRLLVGSTGATSTRWSTCPVVVVRTRTRVPEPRSVVVGVDGSPSSIAALTWASGHAAARQLPLRVVRAWTPPHGTPSRLVDGYAEKGRAQAATELTELTDRRPPGCALQVRTELVDGGAGQVLIDAALHAELLVLGSSAVSGFPRSLLGSTGSTCLTHAPSSIAIIHSPDAVSSTEGVLS